MNHCAAATKALPVRSAKDSRNPGERRLRRPYEIALAFLALFATTLRAADKMTFALDWVPEPEFGGIYAAEQTGAFAANGLSIDIKPGGAGAPTWQRVASGKADFGVAAADEIVLARAQGVEVVAIFATFQTNPQAIMAHAARGFSDLKAAFAAGGTLAIEPGLPYTKFLVSHFDLSKVKRVSYDGGIANFLADKTFLQQCFATSEPLAAKAAGADPQTFLIADAGYNPYAGVIVTTSQHIADGSAAALVKALQAGWRVYLENPKPANELMGKINASMDPATFQAVAEAQKRLIETDSTRQAGLGAMSSARWEELISQLADLKLIGQKPDPTKCFAAPAR